MFDVFPVTSTKPTDCGPTCLQMLLDYYGIDVDLDTLITECGTRLVGCSGADLLRVGRAHGLTGMTAFQMPAKELLRQDRPAIIWWRRNHWVVFCGLNEQGEAVICNPDRGRFPLDTGTFASYYSGVSLWNGAPHELPLNQDYFGENTPETDYFND